MDFKKRGGNKNVGLMKQNKGVIKKGVDKNDGVIKRGFDIKKKKWGGDKKEGLSKQNK